MAYIGNTPADKFLTLAKQSFSTSATTSYTLDSSISSTQDIALFINSVRQSPVDAYTVSGTALTLTSATAGTDEMYCVYLGKTVGTVSPSVNSITNAMMTDDSVGVAELSATGTASSSVFLRGDNSWASAGGTNTPSFLATKSASQTSLTDNTVTKITFGTEIWDTDSAYDTSTSKFTIPSGEGGKYTIFAGVNMEADSANTGDTFDLMVYVNGSNYKEALLRFPGNPGSRFDMKYSTIASLSAGDYVELYGRVDTTSGSWNMYSGNATAQFGAYKLIT